MLMWMAVIFSASSDTHSFQHSSRILEPIIRWLFPQLAERTVWQIVFIIRKCAHLTEYAILAWLLLHIIAPDWLVGSARRPPPLVWPASSVTP